MTRRLVAKLSACALLASASMVRVAADGQHGAPAHGPAPATADHGATVAKTPAAKPAAGGNETLPTEKPPVNSHASPSTATAAPSSANAPRDAGTGSKPRPTSVATVVQRIQQRIENEVKPEKAPQRAEPPGGAERAPSSHPR